jgi:hypothetical protein
MTINILQRSNSSGRSWASSVQVTTGSNAVSYMSVTIIAISLFALSFSFLGKSTDMYAVEKVKHRDLTIDLDECHSILYRC